MVSVARRFQHDDIARLEQHFGLPDLGYHDISASMELDKAIRRWPLMTELSIIVDLDAAIESAAPGRVTAPAADRQPA